MGIFLSVLSGVLALANGIACSKGSDDRKQIYVFNLLAPLFTMVLALLFRVNWSVVFNQGVIYPFKTILILTLSGFCGLGYVMLLMFAMNTGPHALSLCLGESCLVIPYLYSVIFWKDKMNLSGILGLILIILSIFAIGFSKEKKIDQKDLSDKWFLFMMFAFVLGGVELTLYTIPNRWEGWADTANLRPALIQVGRMVMLIPLLVKKIKPQKKTTVIALIAAVFNLLVVITQFKAMDYLVKDQMLAVLYPIAIGTYILLFSAYGTFYRKEKLRPIAWISMLAILSGIILLSF